jgi:hypothetical protein
MKQWIIYTILSSVVSYIMSFVISFIIMFINGKVLGHGDSASDIIITIQKFNTYCLPFVLIVICQILYFTTTIGHKHN